MSAKDIYHDACVHALQKDGWTITHDPLTISVGKTDLLMDLGAERIVAAERNGERIAVEINSFVKLSLVQDLKEAVGQFVLYEGALAESPKIPTEHCFWRYGTNPMMPSLRKPLGRCYSATNNCA
jgi:hypothetical protein